MPLSQRPQKFGLYDPAYEHDACGVAFVARLDGVPSHETVERALVALANLEHRGAAGADADTGDGAGILVQIPDAFFRGEIGERLPPPGQYGVGTCFGERCEAIEAAIAAEGQELICWRDVPFDDAHVGRTAREAMPRIRQFVVGANGLEGDAFERKLYVIRRVAELAAGPEFVIPSLSSRTLVYKGMLTAPQLARFYPDLRDERFESALALVHSRFSTNTFPSWELAHPYRMISHNGEINTLRGNINWMRARESLFASDLYEPGDVAKLLPIIREGLSDTACLDNAVELLVKSGYSLPHAMMMLIPEAWENHETMSQVKKDFSAYHSCLMEAWDGPASIGFTDGKSIGAVLDRNGLRPSRYVVTRDGIVLMASEVGALAFAPEEIVLKGRLEPGKMFLVDLEEGRIVDDEEL